ncbi:transposase [Streptomyces caelestis]|uniref:transposase n=1 Tax=Streptomyces caelestis TaxID=36816 RepID=UPI0036480204
MREHVDLIVRTSPADRGTTGFATRSPAEPADRLVDRRTVPRTNRETLRHVLREGEVSWRTTTAWKSSTDPDLLAKTCRILASCDAPPADGRMIRVDGFGPPDPMPRKGKARRPAGGPHRPRATCDRHGGVTHLLAALDPATGQVHHRIRERRRWREFLGPLKALQKRRPGEKPYAVLDGFSPHRHAEVRTRAAGNDVGLVFLPTYGS